MISNRQMLIVGALALFAAFASSHWWLNVRGQDAPASSQTINEDFTRRKISGARPFDPGELTPEGWKVTSDRAQIKYDLGGFYKKGRVEFEIKGPLNQQPKRVLFAAWNQEAATAIGRNLDGALFQVRLVEGGMMLMLVNIAGGRSVEAQTGPLAWEDKWYRIAATWDTGGGQCELWRDGVLLKREPYTSEFEGLRWAFIGRDNYKPGVTSVPGLVYRYLKITVSAPGDPEKNVARDTSATDRELCDKGSEMGCAKLGLWLARDPGRRREAAALLEQGCAGRVVAEACIAVGRMYFTGDGVTKDEQKSGEFFARGCEHGNARHCRRLAAMHRAGDGAPKDATKAAAFERQACARVDAGNCRDTK